MKKILLIDDEKPIAETIEAYAKKENMQLTHCKNGEEGLAAFWKETFDAVLVDWMLPGISGIEIIKAIREKSNTPILMISARNDETDIVLGLEMGADDYITKPFGPRELIARIYSLLRRQGRTEKATADEITIGKVRICFKKKELYKKGKLIELTSKEWRILEELHKQKGYVVSRETLMERALGYNDFLNDRTLDTHIKNIRKKIEDHPQKPQIIKTIRESGFKLIHNHNDETAG